MSKVKKALVAALVLVAGGLMVESVKQNTNPTDITQNDVMITNKSQTHGGTGITFASGLKGSYILTNRHVCEAVKDGGVVKSTTGQYQVQAILESQVSDLCLVFVPSNLKQQTKLANYEPATFSNAKISGHPALMPTVISTGHFSERAIIPVFTGMKPCTAEEESDPNTALYCAFFGGIPVIKSYESILVTATIMPGSSGSGVYNSNNELSGVVFAGQGEFGYAWTVPYDQVLAFLNNEVTKLQWMTLDQTVHIFDKQTTKDLKDVLKKCVNATDDQIINVCSIIKRDVTWVK